MGISLSKLKKAAYLLIMVLQLLLSGCQDSPPEEAIRTALAELEEAVEAGDTGTIMDRLSESAVIHRGQAMDRQSLKRTLVGLFFRYPKRQLTLAGIRIDLATNGKTARARFTALVWGGRNVLPEKADSYQVDSHWVMDGDWKIESLESERLMN